MTASASYSGVRLPVRSRYQADGFACLLKVEWCTPLSRAPTVMPTYSGNSAVLSIGEPRICRPAPCGPFKHSAHLRADKYAPVPLVFHANRSYERAFKRPNSLTASHV